jgi:hypothetical protein
VPSLPVKPCTITRESLLTSMLIVFMLRENNTEGLNPNAGWAIISLSPLQSHQHHFRINRSTSVGAINNL